MRSLTGVFLVAGLLATPMAGAQVFKCTDAEGKTVYSQVPCTKADNKEKVVKLMSDPISDTPVYGNGSGPTGPTAAANAQSATATGNAKSNGGSGGNGLPMQPYGLMRKPASSPSTGPTNQQLVAQCEANHGARCSSAAEINYRRQEQRTPTAQEQATIQAAVRARREREEEQRERAFRR